ncbi:MAG: fumarate hydratase [Firmicutes bacterium]|nr:fumarate hydratase [Bacillota bacterium]
MRTIECRDITDAVARLCVESNLYLPEAVAARLDSLAENETSALGLTAIKAFADNRRIAAADKLALCQDTGVAVVFVELGQEVAISGGLLSDAINAGVARGYREGYLRKSMVTALERMNTGDNTPAVIHLELVAGDRLAICVLPKGGGAENMSKLAMLKPSAGLEGVRRFVLDTVREAGPNPCPPVVVGVGIGGDFERCAELAKKALCREIGSVNPDPRLARLEEEWLTDVNELGIGVQGFGGPNTAIGLFIEEQPCHFASLPVAVNLNCHCDRSRKVVL